MLGVGKPDASVLAGSTAPKLITPEVPEPAASHGNGAEEITPERIASIKLEPHEPILESHPISPDDMNRIGELATVKKGEGVWDVVRRQFKDMVDHKQNLERFGLKPEDLNDAGKVRAALNRETANYLIEEKYL